MDLVDYSQDVFDEDRGGVPRLRREDRPAPTSPSSRSAAVKGDNIVEPRANTPWYRGPDADGASSRRSRSTRPACRTQPFRLPVQWVNRPNLDFRGFAGTIAAGVDQAGRQGPRAAVGPREPGRAHRHGGRRPRTGGRRPVGHAHARRRSRHLARRRHLARELTRRKSPISSRPRSCG